jgi:hypothetical protein
MNCMMMGGMGWMMAGAGLHWALLVVLAGLGIAALVKHLRQSRP